MTMNDPATGPIPRDKFAEIIAAPFGEAAKLIRKFDPLWGRVPGEIIKWRVVVEREVTETGVAYVKAATKEEAMKLADNLPDTEFSWEPTGGFGPDYTALAVEPMP